MMNHVLFIDYYMEETCGRQIDMTADRIETAKLKLVRYRHYRANMDCTMTIKAPVGKQIMIYFTKLDIKEKRIKFGYSCEDYLELFDGTSTSADRVSGIINYTNRIVVVKKMGPYICITECIYNKLF